MKKIQNSLCAFFIVLSCSCQNKTWTPPPPPNIKPPSSAPNFTPSLGAISEIQINRIPHPFDMNGEIPFSVWVDGKRSQLSNTQIKQLAKSLNIKSQAPNNTAKIHSGEGWIYPFKTSDND